MKCSVLLSVLVPENELTLFVYEDVNELLNLAENAYVSLKP